MRNMMAYRLWWRSIRRFNAFIALASAAVLTLSTYTEYIKRLDIHSPKRICRNCYSVFSFIPHQFWVVAAGLRGSIFMITTLKSKTRNMRIFSLEFIGMMRDKPVPPTDNPKWTAATVFIGACAALALSARLVLYLGTLPFTIQFTSGNVLWRPSFMVETGWQAYRILVVCSLLFTTFVVASPAVL